jgi:hypothetical protein
MNKVTIVLDDLVQLRAHAEAECAKVPYETGADDPRRHHKGNELQLDDDEKLPDWLADDAVVL